MKENQDSAVLLFEGLSSQPFDVHLGPMSIVKSGIETIHKDDFRRCMVSEESGFRQPSDPHTPDVCGKSHVGYGIDPNLPPNIRVPAKG